MIESKEQDEGCKMKRNLKTGSGGVNERILRNSKSFFLLIEVREKEGSNFLGTWNKQQIYLQFVYYYKI